MKKVKINKLGRRILSFVLTVALMVGLMPGNVMTVRAEESSSTELSVTAFATPEQLMRSDNFALHNDYNGVAQKVYFGTNGERQQTWYIAGSDAADSIVLLCDPLLPMATGTMFENDDNNKTYSADWNCTYGTDPSEVYPNHYGASDLRGVLQGYTSNDNTEKFSAAEKELMLATKIYTDDVKRKEEDETDYTYYTEDVLYPAYGDMIDHRYITVGTNSADSLNGGLKVSLISAPYDSGKKFWLRAPNYRNRLAACYAVPASFVSSDRVNCEFLVVSAFRLNLSSVLFASAATAAISDASLTDTMTFRVDDTEKIKSKAAYATCGVTVNYDEVDGNVFLYVQDADSVYSVEITEDTIVELSDMTGINNLTDENTKIWLEKSEDNVAYAVMAEALLTEHIPNADDGDCTTAITCSSCGTVTTEAKENHIDDNGDGICDHCDSYVEPKQEDEYYQIANANNLMWFAQQVNEVQTAINAKLTADIDMNGIDWTIMSSFAGTFDGNGYTISGLNGHKADTGDTHGFIRTLADGGVVKNLTFTEADIWNNEGSGAISAVIVYTNNGTVENCVVKESVIQHGNYDALGVVVGVNGGTIRNCASISNTMTRGFSSAKDICGFVWSNSGSIENCFNYDCTYQNGSNRYAFTGINNGTITNCYYYESSETISDTVVDAKTADQFAGGEVAYLLNERKSDNDVVWRQTLTGEKDTIPVLDSGHGIVYASHPCESEFANSEIAEPKAHSYEISEDGTSHTCSVCNKTEKHSDVAIFTVNETEHSITATCPSGCELGTITLSASGETYDGTEKSHVSGEIKGFTPTIVYEKQVEDGSYETIDSTPQDAGTYMASITYTVDADNSKVYTVSTEYIIARKPVTITADNMSMTYGETAPALSYKVSDDTPLVNDEALEGKLSREAGEDAGTYKITQGTVTNDTNPNYDITFNEGIFTINKAQTWKTADCVMNLVYDESSESYTATITKVDGAEYRFGESGEWSTENTLTGIDHDTEVTGYIRIAGDENHNPSTTNSLTLKSGHGTLTYVERKEPDCENAGNQDYWYCESCGKYFFDGNGDTEVSKEFVTIPATNHKWNQENYELDATHHWHNCQNENCPITDNSKKDGYEEHIDSNDDGSCEVCQNRIWYIISPTSMLLEKGESVSNISMDPKNGKVVVGEKVTVTTQDMLGYSFKGWYLASDIDAETKQLGDNANPQATSFTYTFKPEDNMSLVAVYEAAGNADVKISGSGFTVSVDDGVASAVQDGTYSEKLSIGSKVTITIVEENSNFINWSNENNKIVSTERTYTFTVTGQTTLTMSKKGITGSTAMVEFVSAYNQVISGKIYSSTDTIIFPDGPSKMGYIFKGWSLTQNEIQKEITDGETHITVIPVYEQDTSKTYTVTIYVDGVQDDTQTAIGILAGTTKTVKAPTVDGKVFLYWTDADGNILGYDASYFMQVNKDIVVKAVYGEAAVEAKPVIAMTNVFTTSTNGKNKISFTVTRDIPEGYELVEHGVLYNKDGTIANPTEDTFVLGGDGVKKSLGTDMSLSGVLTVNANMTGALDTKVAARGYIIVRDRDGNSEVYYSDFAYISYNEVNSN